ncbi:MAG: hypothetical protein CR996_00940 [Draconibacterium sp.]|nr:MAG: hypothetical protein CR996_00940 [Draconibacterium sp.]PIF06272.1 MAG: hypothetical protein CSA36_02465 [Draconibacterium sp.]
MKRIIYLLSIQLLITISAIAQDDETLITIDNNKISKAEFEHIYKKNNSNLYNNSDKKSPEEYLDLFINYKLKVIEAEDLKMDTSASFINELKGYRDELAAPYLTDISFDEKLVEELYDRMTKEVSASHILLTVDKSATPEQEQKVLDKITKIRSEILNGKNFAEAAIAHSEDPSAKINKGKLGYFTAFQMVVPFENMAFNTPVGQISQPVRTSFGYHIIQVHDIRDNKGEIQVAHIIKMFPKGMTPEVKNKLKLTIDSIYTELKNGADFSVLARATSDDKRSAEQGGIMPWFTAARIIPEIGGPAFALENDGDITKPIESPFGYHILKRISHRPVPSFELAKNEIENRIKSNPQRRLSEKKAFVDKLKKAYGFSENQQGMEILKNRNVEDNIEKGNVTLFSIDSKNFTLNDFNNYLASKNIKEGSYLTFYQQWTDDEMISWEDANLEKKYPEFRYLLQEYHNGILLFNISEEKIWNFASSDSVGLQKFYERNKKNYKWEERFKGLVIKCIDVATREEAENYFAEDMPVEEIKDRINGTFERITIKEGAWEKGNNAVVDYYVWNQPAPDKFESETTFVRGNLIPPEPKTLKDAYGLYVSDYQKFIEEEWIKELRKKHRIKVNRKLLKTVESVK